MKSLSTTNANGRSTLFDRNYITIMIANFLISGGFYLVNVIISSYVVSLGMTQTVAGTIIGCFSLTSLIARPFSGILANHASKKKLMVASVIVMALATYGYTLFHVSQLLILIRVCHGVGFALFSTVSLVMISAIVPSDRMSEGIANYGLSQMLASAVMPNISSALSKAFGYLPVFYLAVALELLGGLLVLLLRVSEKSFVPSSGRNKVSIHDLICIRLLPLACIGGLFSLFNGVNSSFMLLLGSSRGIGSISLYFTVNTIAIVVIRLLLSRIADRTSIMRVILPAIVSAVLAALMLGYAAGLTAILIAAVFQAGGQGMAQPSLQADCIKRTDEARRGTASSTYYMCSDIGQGLGAMIGGAISDRWGYTAMYNSVAGFFLVALACSLFLIFRRKEKW